jgi:hypothetical protein
MFLLVAPMDRDKPMLLLVELLLVVPMYQDKL